MTEIGHVPKEQKMKRRWHDFLCRLFRHRWEYVEREELEFLTGYMVAWRFCKRCAKAECLGPVPSRHPMCRCIITPHFEEEK